MRDLILQVRMTDEEAALYEGRMAMVVPLSDADAAELRLNIVGLHELLEAQASEVREADESLRAEVLREAPERMARVRELIGRAAFVGAAEVAPGKAVLQ